jgi:TIR domain
MIGISYRREDTAPITGRIYDRLQALFGRDRVFMDLDSIPFGVDFRTHISEALNRCDTLLVVIGPHWLGVSADGSRRIDDATDFVRFEDAQALSRDIRVIPLLIDRTEMPSSTVLPDDLKSLAFRNALRVDSDADFHHHINRLCSSLQPAGSSSGSPARSSQPVATTPSPSAPANQVPPLSTVESCQTPWSAVVAFAPVLVKVGVWILIFGILLTSGGIIDHKSVWPIVIGGIMIVVPILCFVFFVPHLKRRK